MPRSTLPTAVLAALLTALSGTASAQPVVDPNFLEFTASADHGVTNAVGPVVSRYDLVLYPAAVTTPARTVNLGKPVPDSAGTIRLSLRSLLDPLPAPGVSYAVRVVAIGPGGSAASALSNAFSFGAPCAYSVSPASRSVAATAGTSSFTVSAAAGCAWTATSGAAWATITGGAAGSGNGTVTFNVSANTGTVARNTTLTIAGQSRGVSQAARTGCTFTVAPLAHRVRRTGATVSVTVTAPAGCAWTASEGSSWLAIASGAAGNGNGTVSVAVGAYTGTATRSATATIAGRAVSFSQSALPPAPPAGFRVVPR